MSGGGLPNNGTPEDEVHPARRYFAQRLDELMRQFLVVPTSQGRKARKLTLKGVHGLLCEHAPHEAPSQTQLYRYSSGEAAPTVVDVDLIASVFGVSPRSFLREDASRSEVHLRLRPLVSPAPASSEPRAAHTRCRLRQVEQLAPGMKGRWLVVTQNSFHLWDLDAMTYIRIPGRASLSGPFPLDLQLMAITRVDLWPRVGSTSLLWFDDPSDPDWIEQCRRSSPVVSITEIADRG